MVSLYVHSHKSLQIDAWLMDLISCKFPICFTLFQMSWRKTCSIFDRKTGSLYFRWNCGIGSCSGCGGTQSTFSECPYTFKKQIERKKTTCSQNVTATRASSDWNGKEWPSPHWQTVGFPGSFKMVLLSFCSLPPTFPLPVCVCIILFTS